MMASHGLKRRQPSRLKQNPVQEIKPNAPNLEGKMDSLGVGHQRGGDGDTGWGESVNS